ncbi:MAG: divalent-cation tolerance protein CutA [Saprospiraceae bacterium]|nr:divalent-cation tolerance protein CutA [Saprospiraceae bacterium]MBK7736943.1 divalent-cation tolerance protein CutA [Saprospiraceae bacterium]MBK7914463.1 divalent-cation tolerance protein CutA [Saprospiraceae bacterium]
MKNKIVLYYVPFPSEKSANKIGNYLLVNEFAVCIQTFKVISNYIWNEKLTKGIEYIAIIKTNKQNEKSVYQYIASNHPYEVPCIIKLNGRVNKKYAFWMNGLIN